jgi:IS30 family transposase
MRRGYVKGKHSRLHIPQRVPIAQRPASIDARSTVGHWEVDTVGNRKTRRALLVIHERKTRLTKLRLLQKRTAAELRKSLVRALRYLPPQLRRSLTFDKGYENSEHLLINESLGTHSYFCAPFHSWEKGSVENTISILRRIIPKSYNLRALSRRRLRRIEHWLNSRPKKCLAFRTPAEVFRPTHCKLRNAPLLSHHPAKQRRPTGGDRPAKE